MKMITSVKHGRKRPHFLREKSRYQGIVFILEDFFIEKENKMARCAWAEGSPLYRDYHDHEWGKPQFDSQKLFEKLCIDGQQAGL